jgi:hypothetical protein
MAPQHVQGPGVQVGQPQGDATPAQVGVQGGHDVQGGDVDVGDGVQVQQQDPRGRVGRLGQL